MHQCHKRFEGAGPLDTPDAANDFFRRSGADHRRDQFECLGLHFGQCHRVGRCAAHGINALANHTPGPKRYLDNRLAQFGTAPKPVIGNQRHASAQGINIRITHARVVVGCGKTDGAINKHDGGQILDIDVRHFAAIDNPGGAG